MTLSLLWQFIDDPGLRNDTRNMPVQLPLAHSGWLFKEENEEPDVKPWLAGPKEEDMEVDVPVVKVKELKEINEMDKVQ